MRLILLSLPLLLSLLSPLHHLEAAFVDKLPYDAVNGNDNGYCCLPAKWHASLTLTSSRRLQFFPLADAASTGAESTKPPIQMEVSVNYRQPQFELRMAMGSVVYWRGYMWLFGAELRAPRLLGPTAPNHRPSGGYAPLFFRCLAPRNGFQRLNASHYRLVEADSSESGRRLGIATVTDVFVREAEADNRRHRRPACQLEGFQVHSKYVRHEPGRGVAMATDTDAYAAGDSARTGRPDPSLTQRAQSGRGRYRSF